MSAHPYTPSTDRVGPVLEAGEVALAIIEALRAEHADLLVQDRGAYMRVLVPRACRVTRQAIERALGRPFRLPADLELVMPSFKGFLTVSADEVRWTLERSS
jgi:toluene monooxygenase system protein D